MELNRERLIPASVDATWDALTEPETPKRCIAGCESLDRAGAFRSISSRAEQRLAARRGRRLRQRKLP